MQLRYDFKTNQEYFALCSYLDKNGYDKEIPPNLSGMWGGWHIVISLKSKTYIEDVKTGFGSLPTQCKTFTETIKQLEHRFFKHEK